MPWQLNGTFLRTQGEQTASNVWELDQGNNIKIIATRHDTHDEDLALGIAACLNLDGLNAMRANLDMGTSYKIENLAKGTANTDATRKGQLISGASFDDPTRTLSLTSVDESTIQVVIPSGTGGGGSGTVTSIDIGEGLTGATDPITVAGDIKLETIGTLVTESNGIASITVDKHGRVTQVVGGAFDTTGEPDQTLSKSQNSGTTLTLTLTHTADPNDTVTINSATTSIAGLLSAADKTTYDGYAASIATNASDISTNAGNIATNTSAISTNTGNIATNTSAISTINNTAVFDSDFPAATLGLCKTDGNGSYGTVEIAAGAGISVANGNGGFGNPTISANLSTFTDVGGVDNQRVYIQSTAPVGASTNDIWIDIS